MSAATDNSMYLGLPSIISRNKSSILGFLKNKIKSRINSWDGKLLSRAAKEILLKSVVQSLPSYAMSVFLLPVKTCTEIERLMAQFWWKTTSSKGRGIVWMNWDHMASHKTQGGLAFGDFLTSTLLYLLKSGVPRTIGTREQTSILRHPWLPLPNNPYVSSLHPALMNQQVSSFLQIDSRQWDVGIVRNSFNQVDADAIMSIPLSFLATTDFWAWSGERSGQFSVKSAYRLLQDQKDEQTGNNYSGFWVKLWQLKIPPKVKNLLWRAVSGCLPTSFMLCTKNVDVPATCPVCQGNIETIMHALVTCPFAHACLNKVSATTSLKAQCFSSLLSLNFASSCDVGEHWTKPETNTIKMNVDAAMFEEDGMYGFRIVARDDTGRLIRSKSSCFLGAPLVEVAEARVKEALSWIKNNDWQGATLETDSVVTV
uniref:Reverse transcriptase zinc-binding domain-containing protein n=1 Tax=Cannabis sativa TaxID=3483 RepID=A0A803PY00_CANSA